MSLPGRARFDHLYAEVLAEVIGGQHRPGDRIAIKELSERLKVSTTPLREILSRLAGRGLLEERRSEGYYIARLDARDIADLFDLHGICVERAIASLNLRTACAETITDPWDLFEAIVRAADNVALAEMQHYLADRLSLLRPFEGALIGPPETDLALLKEGLASETVRGAAAAVRRFHERRRNLADKFALQLGRRLTT